mmetsp:Transcript_18826/g.75517  ORF Transcript_18826/g.75517 Transcript_18826/m.75517 type:complete len:244 (+) Transcript_18826:2417-3148(+)
MLVHHRRPQHVCGTHHPLIVTGSVRTPNCGLIEHLDELRNGRFPLGGFAYPKCPSEGSSCLVPNFGEVVHSQSFQSFQDIDVYLFAVVASLRAKAEAELMKCLHTKLHDKSRDHTSCTTLCAETTLHFHNRFIRILVASCGVCYHTTRSGALKRIVRQFYRLQAPIHKQTIIWPLLFHAHKDLQYKRVDLCPQLLRDRLPFASEFSTEPSSEGLGQNIPRVLLRKKLALSASSILGLLSERPA